MMNEARTRPTLGARIAQRHEQSWFAIEPSRLAPPRQSSFTERYRGTEFEAPAPVRANPAPSLSRGRVFVLLAGSAGTLMTGLIIVAMSA